MVFDPTATARLDGNLQRRTVINPKAKLTNVRYRAVQSSNRVVALSPLSHRIFMHGFIGFMSNRKRTPEGAARLDRYVTR